MSNVGSTTAYPIVIFVSICRERERARDRERERERGE